MRWAATLVMILPVAECRNRMIKSKDPTTVQIDVNNRYLVLLQTAKVALWWVLNLATSHAAIMSYRNYQLWGDS